MAGWKHGGIGLAGMHACIILLLLKIFIFSPPEFSKPTIHISRWRDRQWDEGRVKTERVRERKKARETDRQRETETGRWGRERERKTVENIKS